MLKCYEIFESSSPELVNDIFMHLLEKEKAVYKAVIQNVASQRRLRPVFIERKPKLERHLWLKQALSRKPADDFAVQILQIWLLGAKRELICEFLDQLGIQHDGKGVVDNLPEEPDRERLEAAVDALLEKYPGEATAVYLHAFQAMDDQGWNNLERILENDPRLALGAHRAEPRPPVTSGVAGNIPSAGPGEPAQAMEQPAEPR